MKKRYAYDGQVTQFGKVINRNWYGETAAVSDKKAKSNLIFQYKEQYGFEPFAKVELPGKVYLIEE